MCVIVYVPVGKKISKNELMDCFDYNSDGCGMAWIKDNKVNYTKGYTNFEVFYDCMKDTINNDNIDRVFHFRITSRGTTNVYQTHPFMLSDKKDDMDKLDYCGETPVLFMNGTITTQKVIKGLNDTASFIIDELSNGTYDFNNKKDLNRIDKLTGAKWAIVQTTGVELVGNFDEEDGIFFSNLYHRWYNYNNYYTSYSKSSKSNKFEIDNADWYGEWLDREYGADVANVYYDSMWFDDTTPTQALGIALEYYQLRNDDKVDEFDDYNFYYDDCFYYDYTFNDLIDEFDCEIDGGYEPKTLADYFPEKSKDIQLLDECATNKSFRDKISSSIISVKKLCGLVDDD